MLGLRHLATVRLLSVVVGATALATALAGCGGASNAPGPSATSPASPSTTASPGIAAVPGGVTEAQAAQLCSDMEAQLQSWRTYTPTIGKTGLNTLIGTWAAQNGINVIELAHDRGRIDVITTAACPTTRDGALYALELPDLASGLIGF